MASARRRGWLLAAFVLVAGAGLALRLLPGAGGPLHVPGDHLTIEGAVDAASRGQVVLVSPGTYRDSLTIRGRRVVIRAEDGPGSVVLHTAGTALVVTDKAHVTLEGLTLVSDPTGPEGVSTIRINSGSLVLRECRVTGSSRGGLAIEARSARSIAVEDSVLTGGAARPSGPGGSALYALECGAVKVVRSTLEGSTGGSASLTFSHFRGEARSSFIRAGRGGFPLVVVDVKQVTLEDSTLQGGRGGDGIAVAAADPIGERGDAGGGRGGIPIIARRNTTVKAEGTRLIPGAGGHSGGFGSANGPEGRELVVDTGSSFNGRTGDMNAWVLR